MHTIANDTETGGLYPSIHALLSIGAACSWTGEQYLAYITAESQPGKTVEAAAAKKNGYSRTEWEARGARPVAVVMPEFLEWVAARKKERPEAVLLCHHLAFDKGFYAEAARVCRLELPHRNDWVCSQVKFTELMKLGVIESGSSGLDRLMQLAGWAIERSVKHDALEDALITLHCYPWLLEKAKCAEATVKHLYDIACQDRRRLENLVCEIADRLNQTASFEAGHKLAAIIAEEAAAIRGEKKETGETAPMLQLMGGFNHG